MNLKIFIISRHPRQQLGGFSWLSSVSSLICHYCTPEMEHFCLNVTKTKNDANNIMEMIILLWSSLVDQWCWASRTATEGLRSPAPPIGKGIPWTGYWIPTSMYMELAHQISPPPGFVNRQFCMNDTCKMCKYCRFDIWERRQRVEQHSWTLCFKTQ